MAKKKMKRYNGEDGSEVYTGNDEIVKYRMGMTDKAKAKEEGPSESTIEDESDRGNVSPAAAEFNKDTGNEPSTPAKKAAAAVKKTIAPAVKKADKDTSWDDDSKIESPAPKPAPTRQQKNAPTMIRGAKNTGTDLKSAIFGGPSESPRMKAAKRAQAMDANNYSMKKGGKVKSASARADGCAIRGKTRA